MIALRVLAELLQVILFVFSSLVGVSRTSAWRPHPTPCAAAARAGSVADSLQVRVHMRGLLFARRKDQRKFGEDAQLERVGLFQNLRVELPACSQWGDCRPMLPRAEVPGDLEPFF